MRKHAPTNVETVEVKLPTVQKNTVETMEQKPPSVAVPETVDTKLAAVIPIIPLVSEVLKDDDIDEPEWFNFPGKGEYEKILPKKYWENHQIQE